MRIGSRTNGVLRLGMVLLTWLLVDLCVAFVLAGDESPAAPQRAEGVPAETADGASAEPIDDADAPLPKLNVKDQNRAAGAPSPPRPTARNSSIRTSPIPRKPQNAEEMLRHFDVDASLLRQLVDHQPLQHDESEAVVRILFALPKLPAEFLEQWTEQSPDWDAIIESPQDYRMKVYYLAGRVTRVERVPLIEEAALRFDFSHYYRATVELGDDHWQATVCARHVPGAWKIGEPIDEAVSFRGLLLKMGDGPVFAANRLAWHPNHLDAAAGITKSHVYLGDLGMDIGLWDDVRDKRPLRSEDRECFYQLLAATGRTKQEFLRERATADFKFTDLLSNPAEHHGRLLRLEGTAHRCAKIVVNDKDIRARLGIDHYYEIYVLIRLKSLLVYKEPDRDEKLEFTTFPIVVCVNQLPPGMPEGDNIHEAVSISGVFFKLWAYESAKMTAFQPGQDQLCPMFVALQPDVFPRDSGLSPYVGVAVGGLFILALLGVWIGVWRFGREDAEFKRSTLLRQYEVAAGKSLNDVGLVSRGAPDFSHLAAGDGNGEAAGDAAASAVADLQAADPTAD